MNRPDGTTIYSSGWIACVGSKFQKDHPDSKEAFFNDMMKLSGYRSDPECIKVYAEEAGDGVDWLASHGTPFYLWENLPAPELSRCLISPGDGITGGSQLVRCVLKALEKKGVPIHYNTKAIELITDDLLNVKGVVCLTKDKRVEYLAKGGVILTTGGYAAKSSHGHSVHRSVGISISFARFSLDYRREHHNDSKSHGQISKSGSILCWPMTPTGKANPSPLMHARYGIQVNSQGKRFVEETWLQVPKSQSNC